MKRTFIIMSFLLLPCISVAMSYNSPINNYMNTVYPNTGYSNNGYMNSGYSSNLSNQNGFLSNNSMYSLNQYAGISDISSELQAKVMNSLKIDGLLYDRLINRIKELSNMCFSQEDTIEQKLFKVKQLLEKFNTNLNDLIRKAKGEHTDMLEFLQYSLNYNNQSIQTLLNNIQKTIN